MNVAAFSSVPTAESTLYDGDWVVNCTKEELLQCYHGWEPEVVDMLAVRTGVFSPILVTLYPSSALRNLHAGLSITSILCRCMCRVGSRCSETQ